MNKLSVQESNPQNLNEFSTDNQQSTLLSGLAGALPWVISILLHVGIFLVMLIFIVFSAPKPPQEITVPRSSSIISPQKTTYTKSSARSTSQNKSTAKTKATSPVKSNLNTTCTGKNEATEVFALTGDAGTKGGAKDKGLSNPGPGKSGTGGPFIGQPLPVKNVIFVIDRSGSMVDTFDQVSREMLKTIWQLGESQNFQIILFAEKKPLVMNSKLVPATVDKKLFAARFLATVETANSTDPVPAIKVALKLAKTSPRDKKGNRSVAICLLTDGQFDEPETVITQIRKLNTQTKCIINTFLYDCAEQEAVPTMKQIADENFGNFTNVQPD